VDADEYRRMAEAGERHWWYRSTRVLLGELLLPRLDRRSDAGPPLLVLDAGGGTGATGGWMTASAATVLADFEPMALDVARHDFGAAVGTGSHGLLPVQADLNRLPFADDSFDLVLCVTALCHRMNPDPGDRARLRAHHQAGRHVCLWEPGGKRLWRGHDEVTHTGRRFSVGDLRDHGGRGRSPPWSAPPGRTRSSCRLRRCSGWSSGVSRRATSDATRAASAACSPHSPASNAGCCATPTSRSACRRSPSRRPLIAALRRQRSALQALRRRDAGSTGQWCFG
jgi:SAM-dependent methyltransferase